jgi:hypothetical protein
MQSKNKKKFMEKWNNKKGEDEIEEKSNDRAPAGSSHSSAILPQ